MIRAFVCVAALAAGAAVRADLVASSDTFGIGPGGAIDTFDTSDPFGTLSFGVYQLGVKFPRGMEFVGPEEAYFVSSFHESGFEDQTGLYRLKGGAITRVGDVPYQSPTLAGMTAPASRDSLLVLNQKGWRTGGPGELFRVGFDGEWTQIATIDLPGVADETFQGFALDWASGDFYTVDKARGVLYRIDGETYEATKVGALGPRFPQLAGMTFTTDGRLLLAGRPNKDIGGFYSGLYDVDVGTGKATLISGFDGNVEDLSVVWGVPAPGAAMPLLAGLGFRRKRR